MHLSTSTSPGDPILNLLAVLGGKNGAQAMGVTPVSPAGFMDFGKLCPAETPVRRADEQPTGANAATLSVFGIILPTPLAQVDAPVRVEAEAFPLSPSAPPAAGSPARPITAGVPVGAMPPGGRSEAAAVTTVLPAAGAVPSKAGSHHREVRESVTRRGENRRESQNPIEPRVEQSEPDVCPVAKIFGAAFPLDGPTDRTPIAAVPSAPGTFTPATAIETGRGSRAGVVLPPTDRGIGWRVNSSTTTESAKTGRILASVHEEAIEPGAMAASVQEEEEIGMPADDAPALHVQLTPALASLTARVSQLEGPRLPITTPLPTARTADPDFSLAADAPKSGGRPVATSLPIVAGTMENVMTLGPESIASPLPPVSMAAFQRRRGDQPMAGGADQSAAAIFAGVTDLAPTAAAINGDAPTKKFLPQPAKRVMPASDGLGIATAKTGDVMASGSFAHRSRIAELLLPAVSTVGPAIEQSPVSNATGAADELHAPGAAQRAVETVLHAIALAPAGRQPALQLHFSVGGDDLVVRVQWQHDEVRAVFHTDSPELRAALAEEWRAVVPPAADRPVRLAEAQFCGLGNFRSGDFAEGRSPRQHHRRDADSVAEPGNPFSRQHSSAASPAIPLMTTARPPSRTSLHLQTLA